MTQYSTGYNYPPTVKPEVVQMCEVRLFFWRTVPVGLGLGLGVGVGVGVRVCV